MNPEHHKKKDGRAVFPSVILIIIFAVVAYSNSLNNEFIWDDEFQIEKNEYIKSSSYLPHIFSKDLGAGGGKEYGFYRPIQLLTYMMDYSLWKLDVKGYHVTNIVLHILVALSIFCFIKILFDNNLLSFLTASLYVVHPIHTEVVTYISGRADALAVFFMLLCMLIYIKSLSSKNAGLIVLMSLSYLLALFSRENSLILPVLLLLYHYSFKKKIQMGKFVPIASLAVLYILLRVTILRSLLAVTTHTSTLSERLPGFFVALINYIRLLFLPFNLHMEYGTKLFDWGNPNAVLGVFLFIGLSTYAFISRRKNDPLVFFSISWFFITLIPVSNLYPINAYMAEHWLYLPSLGFFLMIAHIIDSMYRSSQDFRVFSIVITAGLLIFYSFLTMKQNMFWKDPLSFYERTLTYAEDSSKASFNLGLAYRSVDREEDAINIYKKAIEIDPDYAEAHYNLGIAYKAAGKNNEAIASFQKAIDVNPDYFMAYNNLGNVYKAVNKDEEAIVSYKKAIKIDPEYAEAHSNLGVLYATTNRNEEAMVVFKKAIEIDPDYAEAHYNLGIACKAAGKNNEAIASFQKAIDVNPDYFMAYNNLGSVYKIMKKNNEAIGAFQKAIDINSDYAPAYSNLSAVYFENQQFELAIEYLDQAQKKGFSNPVLFEALQPYRKMEEE